jgi:hypothetical protein
MHWTQFPLPALALATLTACAGGGYADRTTAARDSGPLAMEGLLVLSEDGERMLGTVENVITGPNGQPTHLVIASRPPAFAVGERVTVPAEDVTVSMDRNAAILTGLTTEQFAELATSDDMIALSGSACADCLRAPTNWSGTTR